MAKDEDTATGNPRSGTDDALMLQPGETLARGRYRIQKKVGGGRYATVYLAIDLDLEQHGDQDTRVAIKILRPDLWTNKMARDRLAREGDLQKTEWLGTHDNVVAVTRNQGLHTLVHPHTGMRVDVPFLVMAFVEHMTLLAYLDTCGGRAPQDATFARIITQLGNALSWIHSREQPVVHRDLASHNVMLRVETRLEQPLLQSWRPDFALLSDFGLAYVTGDSRITNETGAGIAANIDYASPQILLGQTPTPQDDIYAFGVLAYEMLVGHRPYLRVPGDSPQILRGFIETVLAQPPMFSDADRIPERVQDVVLQAMARERADRYRSAREMAQALLGAMELSTTPQSPVTRALVVPELGYETATTPPTRPARGQRPPVETPANPVRRALARFARTALGILGLSALAVFGLAWAGERTIGARLPPRTTPASLVSNAHGTLGPGTSQPVKDRDTSVVSEMTLPPEGGLGLAFIAGSDAGDVLMVWDSEGQASRAISPPEGTLHDPAWSPDSSRLAYVAETTLYVHDGETSRPLGPADALDRWPTWSPNGSELALSSTLEDGSSQILIQLLADGTRRTITTGKQSSWAPAWSPTGEHLAYITESKSGLDVVVIALGDSRKGPVNVSRSGNVKLEAPAWSPDGRWLVYATTTGLYWVSLENPDKPGKAFSLTTSPYDGAPQVTANGQHILFHRHSGEAPPDLYTIAWQGGEPGLLQRNACCAAIRR